MPPKDEAAVDAWLRRIKQNGLSMVFLIALCGALCVVALWVKPYLEKCFDSHIHFVDITGNAIVTQTQLMQRNDERCSRLEQNLDRSLELIRDVHARLSNRGIGNVFGNNLPVEPYPPAVPGLPRLNQQSTLPRLPTLPPPQQGNRPLQESDF